MNIDSAQLGALRAAIQNNTKAVQQANRINHILTISNLVLSGVLTKEDAMKDELYCEMVSKLESKHTIKAKIR